LKVPTHLPVATHAASLTYEASQSSRRQEEKDLFALPPLGIATSDLGVLTGQLASLKARRRALSSFGTCGRTASGSTLIMSSAMQAQAASRTAWLLAFDCMM
jgi:hypothetical protein